MCVNRGVLELSSCVHFCDIDDVHSDQSILMFKWWCTPLEENTFRVKSISASTLWPGRRSCRQETRVITLAVDFKQRQSKLIIETVLG